MIIIPFFTIENKDSFSIDNKFLSKNQLYGLLSKEFKPEYNQETIKALGIILQSNYSHKEISNEELNHNNLSKDDFYEKYGEKADEYYKKIQEATNSIYNKIILHNNKKVYIPYCYVLNSSADNSEYEYFKNVATPWDCLKSEYKTSNNTEGISINTLNILCDSGYSYENALNYFLKDIQIKETAP